MSRLLAVTLSSIVVLVGSVPALAVDFSRAEEVVRQAQADAGGIRAQAEALFRLAWEGDDPEVAALARDKLVRYGEHALPVLLKQISQVEKRYTADLTEAVISAQSRITGAPRPEYFPALEAAVWHGSIEAKRIAIPQLASRGYGPALIPCIDAAYEHPQLTGVVVDAVMVFRDERGRFFLDDVLRSATPDLRARAAIALGRVGGQARDTLREALRSNDSLTREAAVAGLLPVAGLDDLTALHGYVGSHADDNPELLERVRTRAIQLEAIWEAEQFASPEEN